MTSLEERARDENEVRRKERERLEMGRTQCDRAAMPRSGTNPSLSAIRRIPLRSICSWQATTIRCQ
ncbi:MAG: hypothetical protein ACLFS4_01410, partial [Opitutales bacterium]